MNKRNHSKNKKSIFSLKGMGKSAKILLVAYLVLMFTLAVGGTLAFLMDGSNDVENAFTPSKVTCQVSEPGWSDGSLTKTDVLIKNTGDTDAYIRVAIVVTWQNAKGDVWNEQPVEGEDYSLEVDSTNWIRGSDGYYYHQSAVPAMGDSAETDKDTYTGILIKECKALKAAPEDEYTLHVEVIGSAIQSVPTSVVQEHWGVTVNGTTISK